MKKSLCMAVFLLVGSLASAGAVQNSADTVAGFNYVAWGAEAYDSLTVGLSSKAYWTDAQQSSGPSGVYPESLNFYGDGYLFAAEKSYATDGSNYGAYNLTFTAAGDYTVFMRVAAFDGSGTVTNGDSIYMPGTAYLTSGATPSSQVAGSGFMRESGTTGLSTQWEWYRVDRHILVTEADLAGTGEFAFTFNVAAREGGFALDALVLTTTNDFSTLTSANLDSLFVPEPATLILLACGGIAAMRRRG